MYRGNDSKGTRHVASYDVIHWKSGQWRGRAVCVSVVSSLISFTSFFFIFIIIPFLFSTQKPPDATKHKPAYIVFRR